MWSSLAVAGPISGTVFDGVSTAPVRTATITLPGGATAQTNRAGAFRLDAAPTGPVTLTVTAPGYEPSTEELDLPAEGLDGVVVILYKPGAASEQVTVIAEAPTPPAVGKQDLRREEILRIPGTRGDALQSVKSLPGVSSGRGGGGGQLVIRGSSPQDSKVLVDGIEIPLLYHFFGLQSILPSEFISNIEFLPGGFGAEEGRSTGAVINVTTRSEPATKPTGFVEFSFINVAAMAQMPLGKRAQLSVGLRRSIIDLILPHVVPDSVKFTTAPTYYDGQLRLDWRPKAGHRVSAFLLGSLDNLSLLNNSVSPNDPLLNGATFENETSFTRLIGTWEFGRGKLTNRMVMAAGTQGFLFNVADRYLRFGLYSTELRNDVGYALTKQLKLRAGVHGRLEFRSLAVRFPPQPQEGEPPPTSFSNGPLVEYETDFGQHVTAAYVAADIRPRPGTTLSTGLRLDHYYHIDSSTLSPRVQLAHQLSPAWQVRATWGSYSRGLEQAESVPSNLEPERANQYVAGVETQVADGLSATLTGFYTDRHRLVVRDPAADRADPLNSYVNTGTGRSFGMEGLLRLRRQNLFGWLAYTLQRSDRIDRPKAARRLFDSDQTHNVVAVASYKLGKWEFGGRFQYATGTPLTPIIGASYLADANIFIPEYGGVNSSRIEAAHQLDIRIDRRWKLRGVELSAFLDVTNVYAHARVINYQYNFDYTQRQAVTDLPILPAIGLRGTL